jgi:hypothetical protein
VEDHGTFEAAHGLAAKSWWLITSTRQAAEGFDALTPVIPSSPPVLSGSLRAHRSALSQRTPRSLASTIVGVATLAYALAAIVPWTLGTFGSDLYSSWTLTLHDGFASVTDRRGAGRGAGAEADGGEAQMAALCALAGLIAATSVRSTVVLPHGAGLPRRLARGRRARKRMPR